MYEVRIILGQMNNAAVLLVQENGASVLDVYIRILYCACLNTKGYALTFAWEIIAIFILPDSYPSWC